MVGDALRPMDNGSVAKAHNKGLKGQPWRVPLYKLKVFWVWSIANEALG